MTVPFDVVAEGEYLHSDFIGAKRMLTQQELAEWVGPTLDVAVWHRCLQIDFARSTLIGVSAGYRSGFVHPIKVVSMSFSAPENVLRVTIEEDKKVNLMRDRTVAHLRPYQIVKCLNIGNAKVFFNVRT